MGDGFTLDAYRELVVAGRDAGYTPLTVRQYLSREPLPDRFIVYRHDVDRKPGNAVAMARIEADLGVASTYYFRTVGKTFRPALIRTVEALGHEVGYHYEDLDRTNGDVAAARRSFDAHLRRLRAVGPVDTVCMHGNPLTPHDNRALWGDSPDFEAFGLLGEAYLSVDFGDVTYFSDTGRTWRDGPRKIKDWPVGENGKRVQVDTTAELADLISDQTVPRLYVLAHPNRWAATYPELVVERTKDAAINAVKRAITTVT